MTKNKLKMDRLCEQLVQRFITWAEACSDIRAAVIIGSRARVNHSADEWADLDIVVITTDPERYVSTSYWTRNMGDPLLTFVERTWGGDMERRVLFEGMLDVDFAIVSKSRALQLLQGEISRKIAVQISNTFGRGMRVILDKDGIAAQLRRVISSIDSSIPSAPTKHEFLEVVNDFLYHAIFTAKHLRRGELWWTVTCLNCYMQLLLLRMMEWHARAIHSRNYDTWFRGRFLEEWAHPRTLNELRRTFAHYDRDDIEHALLAMMNLFRWTAAETAERLGYSYPTKVHEHLTKWVRACLAQNTEMRI